MKSMPIVLALLCLVSLASASAEAQDGSRVGDMLWWTGRDGPEWDPEALYDLAWRRVRDGFFDPELNGVDWEAAGDRHRAAAAAAKDSGELSAAIDALLAELDTSHMGHYTTDEVEYYHLLDIMFGRSRGAARRFQERFPDGFRYEGLEAWLTENEEGLLVRGIWPGGNAERAGLLTGDVILSIDGDEPSPVAAFRGKAQRSVELRVRRHEDAEPEVIVIEPVWIQPSQSLLNAMGASVRLIERGGRQIGYIHALSYAGEQYQALLLKEIFGEGRLADADALIIDIRGGWGGAQPQYLDPFLKGPVLEFLPRDGPAWTVPGRWRKPVCMLIDEGSRSGKEVLAHGMREYELGLLIGERTAGALVAGSLSLLPDGSIIYLAVADVRVDGIRLEGVGVEPHIRVPFERRFAAGKDPQLDAAVEAMADQLAKE